MLIIEEIKKELDAGREVVAVNKVNGVEHVIKGVGTELGKDALYLNNGKSKFLAESSFKFFSIKRPTPTFNDLIDVAVQAQKDGLIHKMEIISKRSLYISEKPTSKVVHYNLIYIDDGIDYINSLYTETFVIESEEDIKRIELGANVKLVTGFDLTCKTDADSGEITLFYGHLKGYCSMDIPFLKGATVTQKRGAL